MDVEYYVSIITDSKPVLIWKALGCNGRAICTVCLDENATEAHAKERALAQFNRPGRRGYLALWLEGGSKVELRELR